MKAGSSLNSRGRSFPEKLICFFIFLMSAFCAESMRFLIFSYTARSFFSAVKSFISKNIYICFFTVYFVFSAISAWTVWKKNSFKTLKPAISLFLITFLLSIIRNYSFLIKNYFFISLVFSLSALFFSIALNFIVWKKDRLTSIIFLFCTVWSFYLFIMNLFLAAAKESIL